MVFADDEPVSDAAVDSAEASDILELVTLGVSPEVWSALPRLTVAAVRITSVLVPVPPSIEVSCRNRTPSRCRRPPAITSVAATHIDGVVA